MKKLWILALLLLILLSSCDERIFKKTSIEDVIVTVEIDSCEYLIYQPSSLGAAIVHKGNCRNHKR